LTPSAVAQPPRSSTGEFLDALFVAACGLFASWVLLTQAALLLGLTLHTLFLLFDGAVLAALFVSYSAWRRGRLRLPRADGELGILLALSLVSGFLSLGAIRPEVDDVNYAARAVFFLANPHQPLDLAFHDHAFFQEPLRYPLLLTYTGELFWAHLAWLLRIDFLDAYHLIAPFVGGALVPLAWALAIVRFGSSLRGATLGAICICAYLSVDGVSHNGFGNYAFVRIWHGKVLLLSLGIPLFVAFAMDWLERPRRAAWMKLCGIAVSGSGLTGTALFLLPMLALAMGGGHLAARGVSRRSLLSVVGLGSALVHCVAIGLLLWLSTDSADYRYLGFEVGFPESFAGQFGMVFPASPPIAIVAFAVSGMLSLVLLPAARRRLLVGWIATLVIIALNPLVMPLVVDHLSTPNAYWRLFYVLPFPLCVGLASALLCDRWLSSRRAVLVVAIGVVVSAGAANALSSRVTTFGGLRFAPGSYKLRPGVLEELRELAANAAPGSMLAPYEISTTLPLVSAAFPQASVEGFFLVHFARLQGQPTAAHLRHQAALYVGGRRPIGLQYVEQLLSEGLQNVVVVKRLAGEPGLTGLMRREGLSRTLTLDRFVLFRRSREVQ
jgi:hypothetical protein